MQAQPWEWKANAIPDYHILMLPLLRLASDRQEHQWRAAIETLADECALTKAERNEPLPSGSQAVFANRVGWARTYLQQASLLGAPRRGIFSITPHGLELLREKPSRLDVKLLERLPEFLAFRNRRRERVCVNTSSDRVRWEAKGLARCWV